MNIDWDQCSEPVRTILEDFLSGKEISIKDGITLFSAKPDDEKFIYDIANKTRKKSKSSQLRKTIKKRRVKKIKRKSLTRKKPIKKRVNSKNRKVKRKIKNKTRKYKKPKKQKRSPKPKPKP